MTLPVAATASDFADQFESRYVEPIASETPGSALVVIHNGEVVLQKAYGVVEAGSREAVTDDTLFRLASLSKSFASAAASILVRDTSVTWQTPLKSHLNDLHFKEPVLGEQINLKHIMSQTTGLMPHAYTNLIEDNQSYDRILGKLHRVDFICEPGSCYGYQNVVFSLVGDIIEKQSGKTYADFVSERLFQPLAMNNASIGLQPLLADENYARPHVFRDGEWRPVSITPHYYRVAPAAGANASIRDMAQWLNAHLGQAPSVLTPALLEQLHQPRTPTSRRQAHYRTSKGLGKVHYALGWRVFDYADMSQFVHHGGYVRGSRSEMIFNRELGLGLAFLANGADRSIGDLTFAFLDFYRQYEAGNLPCQTTGPASGSIIAQ